MRQRCVDLSAQKDDLSFDRTSVDTSLLGGAHESEVVDDLDYFPQSAGFRVSLRELKRW
jgi:hypothetical protein